MTRPCSSLVYVDESVHSSQIGPEVAFGRYCRPCARAAGWFNPAEVVELERLLTAGGLVEKPGKKIYYWDRPRKVKKPPKVRVDVPLPLSLDDDETVSPVDARGLVSGTTD